MNKVYRRGELYYANLSPVIGSEQGGYRPVLIIQNNAENKQSPTIIIAPISSKVGIKAIQSTQSYISSDAGLARPSIVLLV